MSRVSSRRLLLAAGLAAIGGLPAGVSMPATGEGEAQQVAELGAPRSLGDAADMVLRFIQEDGPESGHVRVVLTPETRPLTMLEARMAAQQGFLAALNEPGLGDALNRVTVVVRLMPASHPSPDAAEQVIVYRYKGGKDWSIQAGE